MRRLFAVLLTFSILAGAEAARADRRVDRLSHLAKVWGAVRWIHPYLWREDVDWDAALLAAIAKVNVADTDDEYATAVEAMLSTLHDPLTHVVARPRPALSSTPPGQPSKATESRPFFEEKGDVVVLTASSAEGTENTPKVRNALLKAKKVILDLRAATRNNDRAWWMLHPLEDALPSHACRSLALRYVQHSGFAPQIGSTSGGYSSGLIVEPGESFAPSTGATPKKVVFVVNENSPLLPVMFALQSAGDGFIVAEGPVSEESMSRNQTGVELGEGWGALVRTTELADEGALRFDAKLPVPAHATTGDDAATKAAFSLLQKPPSGPPRAPMSRVRAARVPTDRAYDDMTIPDAGYRLLALFRVWSVIHYFYPYMHMMERSWDDVLPEFIPKFEEARDRTAYALTMAELATRVPDGHTTVYGAVELTKWFGEAVPAIVVRIVEGHPVITALPDPSAAGGAAVGDVILKVDNEEALARIRRYGKYIAASNPWHHAHKILQRFLGGPAGIDGRSNGARRRRAREGAHGA